MSSYKTTVIDNVMCSRLSGELNAELAKEWVSNLEKHEKNFKQVLHRIHDVRDINAINLNFDDLWGIAQKRLDTYKNLQETLTVFWVSTPLNYGVARMYQSLTDGTPFKIEVFYHLEEIVEFLSIDKNLIENITY